MKKDTQWIRSERALFIASSLNEKFHLLHSLRAPGKNRGEAKHAEAFYLSFDGFIFPAEETTEVAEDTPAYTDLCWVCSNIFKVMEDSTEL